MKLKTISTLIIFTILFSSCVVHVSLGGLFGYQNKIVKANPKIFYYLPDSSKYNDVIPSDSTKVVITNGFKIKESLKHYKNTLVYIWSPNCTHNCTSLTILNNLCDSLNINLIIVAEYYDESKMNRNYSLKKPIVGIDTHYYKSKFTSKYLRGFLFDLTSQNIEFQSFLVFKVDEFINHSRTPNDALQFIL